MRLIKGHDYYDSALAYGADPNIVFIRDSIVVEKEKLEAFYNESGIDKPRIYDVFDILDRNKRANWRWTTCELIKNVNGDRINAHVKPVIAFVAGKRYNGTFISEYSYARSTTSRYIWDYDEFLAFLKEYNYGVHSKPDWAKKEIPINEWYKEHNRVNEKTRDFLIRNKISVLTYQEVGPNNIVWTINGCNLKAIEFNKVLDPYTCNQEISMWVGGILPKDGPPMVEITDDKIKLAKHGMDKWSFRKMKEG